MTTTNYLSTQQSYIGFVLRKQIKYAMECQIITTLLELRAERKRERVNEPEKKKKVRTQKIKSINQ